MKYLKKYKLEILCFIVPIIIMLIVCLLNKTYPFGKWTLAKYDGFLQYPGFTSYYREVLFGHESLFYSFKGGLGYNFFGTFAYYMSNPTNLLCVFFDNAGVYTYYTFIIILRIALSSLTMCIYLENRFKEKNIYTFIFSVAYSLIGYNVCYFFNYMYYDTVVLFPLVILGLDKLIKGESPKLYVIFLTLSIISNFYIGYMVCIFCLLYFIYSYILLEKKNKKIIYSFIIFSLLSGLMCSIILMPTLFDLLNGKAYLYEDNVQTDYFSFNLNFLNIFYKATPGSMKIYDIKYGSVNIYFTLFAMTFVIKYFFNKKISNKEKIVTLIFILFFLLSISFNLIDFAWHMFQRPIWYPNRYIFTFSFFLLVIAYKSCKYKEYIDMKWYVRLIICIVYIALCIYPFMCNDSMFTSFKYIAALMSTIILIQYMFLGDNKYATYLILCLVLCEITLNSVFTVKNLLNSGEPNVFYYNNMEYTNITDKIKSIENKDNNFYRLELPKNGLDNSGAMYLYNGINMFSSLRNEKIMAFLDNFGYDVPSHANIAYNYINPYLNSIFGIKYMSGLSKESYYEKIDDKIFVNKDILPLGFMVDKSVYNYKFNEDEHYDNTKELVNKMLNSNNEIYYMFDNYELYNTSVYYNDVNKFDKFKKIDEDKSAYILFSGVMDKDVLLIFNSKLNFYVKPECYINDKDVSNYFNNNESPIKLNKGDKYYFKFSYTFEFKKSVLDVYAYNYDEYINFVNKMNSNVMNIDKYDKDDYIKASIDVKNDNVLFTSIPYDKGWNVYVDGKKIKYNACFDAFICFDINSGSHDIVFRFIPRGFIIGTIISLISLIICFYEIKKVKVIK